MPLSDMDRWAEGRLGSSVGWLDPEPGISFSGCRGEVTSRLLTRSELGCRACIDCGNVERAEPAVGEVGVVEG